MKYIVALYKNMTPFQEQYVPIGIVLQTNEGLYYKFDLSDDKFNKIKNIYSNADPETFKKFEKTFIESFIDNDKIEITKENGIKTFINNKDPFFLDYLNQTFQSVYQYSKPLAIEGSNSNETLELLFQNIVKKE